jgi:hypothetical protein
MAPTATVELGFRGIDHKVGPVQVIHPLRVEPACIAEAGRQLSGGLMPADSFRLS